MEQTEIRIRRNNAIKAIELMHKARDAGEIKKARARQIKADIAIDKMVNVTNKTKARI